MPRFAANLSMLYNEHAFLDRFIYSLMPLMRKTSSSA